MVTVFKVSHLAASICKQLNGRALILANQIVQPLVRVDNLVLNRLAISRVPYQRPGCFVSKPPNNLNTATVHNLRPISGLHHLNHLLLCLYAHFF